MTEKKKLTEAKEPIQKSKTKKEDDEKIKKEDEDAIEKENDLVKRRLKALGYI
ncbi:MAG: hypothetical protein V1672_02400 [Candidatus Diapherotrites archaeon]